MRARMIFAFVVLAFLALAQGAASAMETTARQAILLDATTGTVLLDKNADQRMPTSSMSKMLTLYEVFQTLREGRLKLDTALPVSERAWRLQGSKMFVELGGQVKVEDLIRGVAIQSGNDACMVLAEGLAGSEESFAARMNQTAQKLGMTSSHFVNSTGWPDPGHFSTARDLAKLGVHLIKDFPDYYPLFAETNFTYHGINQGNRNPLLYRNMGVDGIKTGHTEDAGYGLTAAAKRGNRRLVLVVNGLPSMQARADESARLLEWGFHEFSVYALLRAGDQLDRARVWQGTDKDVPLTLGEDVMLTLSRPQRADMKAMIRFDEPVPAPITKGAKLGTLILTAPDMAPIERPLLAGADVPRLGLIDRMLGSLRHLILGENG